MTGLITDGNFGAWLLKCNPRTWDIERFMADGHRLVQRWAVQDNYRSRRMVAGDPVALWVTGGKPSVPTGVWGTGKVTGAVLLGDVPAESPYWEDASERRRRDLFVPVEIRLFDDGVPREVVKSHPALTRAEVFRSPQMGNPSWLDAAEWRALSGLLGNSGA